MKSFAISSIRAGNLDPEMIDAAVFEAMNELCDIQDVRIALHATLHNAVRSMENNRRVQESAGHYEKAQFIHERIDYYRTCIDLLNAGDVVTFIGRGAHNEDVHVEIPAGEPLTKKGPNVMQSMPAETATTSTQEPSRPAEPAPSGDASMLPALALVEHATVARHKSKLLALLPRSAQLKIRKWQRTHHKGGQRT